MMMDTNIMIDLMRGRQELVKWFDSLGEKEIILPGFVVMELIAGCRNDDEIVQVEAFAENFDIYWPTKDECEKAVDYLIKYRRDGMGVADALIAACAAGRRVPLCTNDNDFRNVTGLKIIKPYDRNAPAQLPKRKAPRRKSNSKG